MKNQSSILQENEMPLYDELLSIFSKNRMRLGREAFDAQISAESTQELFSLERFIGAVESISSKQPDEIALTASFSKGASEKLAGKAMTILPQQVGVLLDEGSTVCFSNIHSVDESLRNICRKLARDLCFPGDVGANCYVSTGNHGFEFHYDARTANSIQIAGSKEWEFHNNPMFPDTPRNGRLNRETEDRGPDAMPIKDLCLTPGSMLSVPRGAWHAARSKGFSIAINLYFEETPLNRILSRSLNDSDHPLANRFLGATADLGHENYVARVRQALHDHINSMPLDYLFNPSLGGALKWMPKRWCGSAAKSCHAGKSFPLKIGSI